MALRFGTTAADTLVIDVSPFRITNTNASDVRVKTSGDVSVGAVTLQAAEGLVGVPVNAGGSNGSVRVDGIRVSVAGSNASSISARVRWAAQQNILTAGQSVVVANEVRTALAVDPMTDHFLIYSSLVIDNTATIRLRETYAGAFASTAEFGQNTPTRLRIRVTDYPTGLIMNFPASVAANEGAATLSTVEGAAVEIPRTDGGTEVTYNFNGAADSPGVIESFDIPFTVRTNGTVANLQPTIEVSLAPIGAAVLTASLPATNVPRFAEENLIALEGSSRIITKTLYWTGIDSSRESRLMVFNPSAGVANVTLSALNAAGELISGPNINNAVRQPLTANQSLSQTLTEIFGAGATDIATVRVQSTRSEVVALGTASAAGFSESVAFLDRGIANFVVPLVGEDGRIMVFNPGAARVSGTLTLLTPTGAVVATESLELDPMVSISRTFQDLFGTPASGQVMGSFSGPLVAFESFGTANSLNFIAAQVPAGLALYTSFFASGGGYETDLSFINSFDDRVTVSAQLVDHLGSPIGTARLFTLAPGEQLTGSVGQLFQTTGFVSGYIRVQAPQISRGIWTFSPAIGGHARIRSQSGSTGVPISVYPQTDASILESGVSSNQFQGIAIVNPNSTAVTIMLQALNSAGAVLGTTTVNLDAGQISSKLVSEYFPVAIPEHSVIRVTSSAPVVTTSVTGSLSGDVLRAATGLH